MKNTNIEVRSFSISNNAESRLITGYSVVFDSLSVDLGGFREIIAPSAITQELILRSDVVMNYNHDDSLILARSQNGEGTLNLSLDERGLLFEFEMPNSALGDQVLESIRRGDVSTCSFAFSLNPDADCETWTRDDNNGIIRTITSIDGLYDCALVVHAAYPETTVSARSLEKIKELNTMKDEELREINEDEKDDELLNVTPSDISDGDNNVSNRAEDADDDNVVEDNDEEPEEENREEEQDESEETAEDMTEEDEDKSCDKEDEEQTEENSEDKRATINKSRFNTKMEKRFSLLKAINDVAEGRSLTGAEAAVSARGAQVMTNAKQEFNGQIQLPVAEMRDDTPVHYTVEADGEHVVVTDYLNILEPLRAKNVLVQAGAKYLTGLKGDIQLPIASDVNVYFEDEIADAQNGAGSFSSIKFAPRRITAEIPLSKMLLTQDTLGVENMVRNLLVTKINNKLEEVILSEAAASGAKPAGIFYNVSPTSVADFADICELESDIADNNIDGPLKYIVSPKAKAFLRSTIKGTNATGMIMEYDEVDGKPAYETTHMTSGNFAVGDWSALYICEWGGIDLLVDPYSWSSKNLVKLVVTAYFDYKVVRDGAIMYGEIASN